MDLRQRNEMIERSMHLIHNEAERLLRRLPPSVEMDDLVSDGVIGLMEALDRFDPSKAKLRTFAARRIRGAMLDGLRSRDPISRSTRRAIRTMETAIHHIRLRTGVTPTPQELAREMGISPQACARISLRMRETVNRSLSGHAERGHPTDQPGQIAADFLPDTRQADPAQSLAQRVLRDQITTGLSRSERLIITLYYYERMTMKEIGATLDICESRVSQMHKTIVARLKTRIAEEQLVA
jgi:RNA polymerase sigma factor FliA